MVLPKIRTMLGSTYRLLKEFVEQGGQLIVTEPGPILLDAMESDLLQNCSPRKIVWRYTVMRNL